MDTFLEHVALTSIQLLSPDATQLDRDSAESVLFVVFSVIVERDRVLGTKRGLALLRSSWPVEPSAAASVLTAWLATEEAVPAWVDERAVETPAIIARLPPVSQALWAVHASPISENWEALARLSISEPFPVPISRRQLRDLKDALDGLQVAIERAEPWFMRPLLEAWHGELGNPCDVETHGSRDSCAGSPDQLPGASGLRPEGSS
jgi:hypothetical protein